MDKESLRAHYKAVLQGLSATRRDEAKESLIEELAEDVMKAKRVVSFESRSMEIDTGLLNAYLASEGKLALFKVVGDELEVYGGGRQLHHFDLLIIPGLVFDQRGYRIGSGKGYIDRFLARYPDVKRVGLCFKEQIYEGDLPIEPHDKKVDLVCAV